MTPYYQHDGITIYCGDNADILPTLSNIDLIVTSPPYNLGVTSGGGFSSTKGAWPRAMQKGGLASGYTNYNDAMPIEEYIRWQRNVLLLMWQALSLTGAIFYNHKPRIQDGEVQLPLQFNPGLPVRQIVIWQRAGGINHSPTYYLPTHEWIMIFSKPEFRLKSKNLGVSDVWYFPQETNTVHPAPFPIGIPARAIETTNANIICDPFMGSGTTLRAALDAGKQAIGIEISEAYCEIAAKRLQQVSMFESKPVAVPGPMQASLL